MNVRTVQLLNESVEQIAETVAHTKYSLEADLFLTNGGSFQNHFALHFMQCLNKKKMKYEKPEKEPMTKLNVS